MKKTLKSVGIRLSKLTKTQIVLTALVFTIIETVIETIIKN